MSNKKFYITTSIAYANAAPHIGFAMEVLQADVLARYHRMLGDNVFYLSGMDEHGSKIKKIAQEKEIEPQKLVDKNSAKFQLLLDVLNVSNNDFIRTTDKVHHWPSAQKLWMKLVDAGDIYKDNYEGYYCVGCEAYLTEKDLVDGKCPNHQKRPEKIKEENYFFQLSKYSNKIKEKIESGELEILPLSRKNEILNVIKDGLKDVSFSRPKNVLDWGIPVPNDENQTMYVWCDALANYISALEYAKDSEKFQKYWPADIHLIGKDILRFHAAIWPGMLISAGLPLPKKILVHGFITSEGQKMSKSLGNVIDPFEVIDSYGVDALRYYLLKEIPSGGDGDFSYKRFEETYQADLANGIGNLVARVMALAKKIQSSKFKVQNHNSKLKTEVENTWDSYEKLLNNFRLNESLETIQKFASICDEYIEQKKPWQIEREEKAKIVYNLLESLRHIAWMIWPFMPETANKIFAQLLANEKERKAELNKSLKEAQEWDGLKTGVKIKKKENLFPRL
jgi:methionyl-tRNA synthetase